VQMHAMLRRPRIRRPVRHRSQLPRLWCNKRGKVPPYFQRRGRVDSRRQVDKRAK